MFDFDFYFILIDFLIYYEDDFHTAHRPHQLMSDNDPMCLDWSSAPAGSSSQSGLAVAPSTVQIQQQDWSLSQEEEHWMVQGSRGLQQNDSGEDAWYGVRSSVNVEESTNCTSTSGHLFSGTAGEPGRSCSPRLQIHEDIYTSILTKIYAREWNQTETSMHICTTVLLRGTGTLLNKSCNTALFTISFQKESLQSMADSLVCSLVWSGTGFYRWSGGLFEGNR